MKAEDVNARLYASPRTIGYIPWLYGYLRIFKSASIASLDCRIKQSTTTTMSLARILPLPHRRILPRPGNFYRTPHRASSTTASASASSFLSKYQSLGPQSRTQSLDANQLQLLSLTLNRPSLFRSSPPLSNAPPPPLGTPLPPGYHLVYFTPAFQESDLGADGTDVSYNPSPPFTRRMWAGGEVRWPRGANGKPNPLRVGQNVTETTRVLSAESKVVKKTGEDMIVVGVEKEFRNEDGVALVDRRYVPEYTHLVQMYGCILMGGQELGLPKSPHRTNSHIVVTTIINTLRFNLPPSSFLIHLIHRLNTHPIPPPNTRNPFPLLSPNIQPP